MRIVKTILCILFGLMFLNAGLDKLFHYMPMPKDMPPEQIEMMGAMMKIKWLMPLVGVIEAVGGLLFAIPKTRALGAIVILPVMTGVLLHNLMMGEAVGLVIAGVLMFINLWMIGDNWNKYKPMIN